MRARRSRKTKFGKVAKFTEIPTVFERRFRKEYKALKLGPAWCSDLFSSSPASPRDFGTLIGTLPAEGRFKDEQHLFFVVRQSSVWKLFSLLQEDFFFFENRELLHPTRASSGKSLLPSCHWWGGEHHPPQYHAPVKDLKILGSRYPPSQTTRKTGKKLILLVLKTTFQVLALKIKFINVRGTFFFRNLTDWQRKPNRQPKFFSHKNKCSSREKYHLNHLVLGGVYDFHVGSQTSKFPGI